ncbi:helix-turn-helix domain-containing protein [Actinoplanes sp. RD1]|uniref:helix-turn-helix domain-containing protein n=1 Tax=Actinoplanes sp. RD1 TaxID=3064538 RepID=UPI002741AA87|nr:helix-turn-helix domain-containing protein [Actinoplanes sp. RD1]
MHTVLDTAGLRPGDRADAVRQFYRDTSIGTADIKIPVGMRNTMRMGRAGRLNLGTFDGTGTGTALCLQKDPVRDGERTLLLASQASGAVLVRQDGRQTRVGPGQLTVLDPTAPFAVRYHGAFAQATARIPRVALRLPEADVRRVTARVFSPVSDPLAALVAANLGKLVGDPVLRRGKSADLVVETTLRLLRGLLARQAGDPQRAREPRHETLPDRILHYARTHLADNDLDAARIAAAHHISVRYLYLVLSREGIALSEWIRAERLAAARADLVSPWLRRSTVAAVAGRWGFADATHFSKVFRRAYGMSPAAWRDESSGRRS